MTEPGGRPRRGAVRSGLVTGLSLAIMSGTAAAVGALLAQKFGRTEETDGFLAAYGVYLVIVIAAQAFRMAVVPDLTRAAAAGRLASETTAYLLSFLLLAVAVSVLVVAFRTPLGDAITGSLPSDSARLAAQALPYLVPAAFAQVLAAIAASALAARDDYDVAAFAYSAGGLTGLVVFIALADEHGPVALAWATVVNAAIALGLPLAALAVHRAIGAHDLRLRLGARLWWLLQAAAVPIAIQGLYLVGVRFSADLGVGKVTSFTYAYLIAAVFVSVTASAVALVSSAPLTRRGLEPESAAAHVVHASWLSLAFIAAAAGVFALVGGRVVGAVLGDAFTGEAGRELGHLVVYLAPWMLGSVAFTLVFPLVFVMGAHRALVPLAVAALALDIPLTWALREAFGLPGIAIAVAVSTLFVLGVLLFALSPRVLTLAARGLGRLAVIEASLAAASFGLLALVLGGFPAAGIGLALYGALLALLRPRGLRDAWAYVRALH